MAGDVRAITAADRLLVQIRDALVRIERRLDRIERRGAAGSARTDRPAGRPRQAKRGGG